MLVKCAVPIRQKEGVRVLSSTLGEVRLSINKAYYVFSNKRDVSSATKDDLFGGKMQINCCAGSCWLVLDKRAVVCCVLSLTSGRDTLIKFVFQMTSVFLKIQKNFMTLLSQGH